MQIKILVIVPCCKTKIWSIKPEQGPTPAQEAYISPTFKLQRQYAEKFGDAWVILSAKYGFIPPDFVIASSYEVSFNQKKSNPIAGPKLRDQVHQLNLFVPRIFCLGGKNYRRAIEEAYAGTASALEFHFAGLPLGKTMQAIKKINQEGFI